MNEDVLWAFVRLVISLPVVLLLAYFGIRYASARRFYGLSGERRMRLVEQLPIGPKGFLTLVEVGGRYYLLAQQEASITLIKEFDQIPAALEIEAAGLAGFGRRAAGIRLLRRDKSYKTDGKINEE
jgi:flagellar protein FliO/FliZ